jgi:protocatechuate 3,4-dioxygenase beta subunit
MIKPHVLLVVGVVALIAVGSSSPGLAGVAKAQNDMQIGLNPLAGVTDAATAASTSVPTIAATGLATMTATPRTCSPSGRGGTMTDPIDPAPERTSVGAGFVLKGAVLSSPDCKPIVHATIILWLAGPDGKYDDDHRATVYTDAHGEFRFESNFPGQYEGMRPHIHLYVSADGYRGLETEYLPNKGQTEGIMEIVLAPLPTPTPTSTATPEGTSASK